MKNIIWLIVGIALIGYLVKGEEQEMRVRIIPNSNEEYDLLIKEEVKVLVLAFLENASGDMEQYLEAHYLELDSLLKKQYGEIKVEFLNHNFPVKTYNGKVMEAGVYKTLLITIDEGKGDNWWASLYPSYVGINTDEKIEFESFLFKLFKKGR